VIVRFVDIGGIHDNYCLDCLFIKKNSKKSLKTPKG